MKHIKAKNSNGKKVGYVKSLFYWSPFHSLRQSLGHTLRTLGLRGTQLEKHCSRGQGSQSKYLLSFPDSQKIWSFKKLQMVYRV